MTRIPTLIQRRLQRVQRRQARVRRVRSVEYSRTPFRFDANLRIGGAGEFHLEIESETGISASWSHRKGELRSSLRQKKCWKEDLWVLDSPLGEAASIDEHVQWLCAQVLPHKAYFATLIEKATWADLWLGCISESAYPALSVKPESLQMLRELNIGLVFNFTCV